LTIGPAFKVGWVKPRKRRTQQNNTGDNGTTPKEKTSDDVVIPARPPWMAEVLETQEQFPVQAGIQGLKNIS
jgi:hypothetical protein